MKVFMINSVCGVGSTGRICSETAKILEKDGHSCKIAYGRNSLPADCEKYAIKIGSKASVYTHTLLSRIFDNSGFCSSNATRKLIEKIKEFDPDVIHLHNLHGYYINVKILFDYLKQAGKPVVWTLHDCWAFTGHCSHYLHHGCDRWTSGCYNCPLKKAYPKSFVFDRSEKNYRLKKELFTGDYNLTLVTPSKWLKEQAEKSFFKSFPIKVVSNGIDISAFKPTESDFREKNGLENKKIVLGVSNVWGGRKGLNEFITLAEKMGEEYKFVLVGHLRGKKIPDSILHVEHTESTRQLAEIYTAADVFLNPTYQEVFGLVSTEALACGTPVITYAGSGGNTEMLDEKCGVVVAKGDTNALEKAISTFSADAEYCVKKAQEFDKNNCFKGYVELYETLCCNK